MVREESTVAKQKGLPLYVVRSKQSMTSRKKEQVWKWHGQVT